MRNASKNCRRRLNSLLIFPAVDQPVRIKIFLIASMLAETLAKSLFDEESLILLLLSSNVGLLELVSALS